MATSVETITDTMASTTIADNGASSAAANEGRRLYIGNVAYATTTEELKDFFTGYAIETTIIPVNPRTQRPVGYAFVEVGTSAEAQKAMEELDGQELSARKVSVQLARKPEEAAAARQAHAAERAGEENGTGRKPGNRSRGGRTRARAGRSRESGEPSGEDGVTPTNMPGQVLPLTEATNMPQNGTAAGFSGPGYGDKAPGSQIPRQQRQRGPPEDGIPSKTKVMVANLPYDFSEEKLKELFGSYQPVSAKIALRPIPRFMIKKLIARNEPRKGRGFGFVTLESEEMQQKSVAEMNGQMIQDREIVVKVAIDSPGKEEADGITAETGPQDIATANGAVEIAAPSAI